MDSLAPPVRRLPGDRDPSSRVEGSPTRYRGLGQDVHPVRLDKLREDLVRTAMVMQRVEFEVQVVVEDHPDLARQDGLIPVELEPLVHALTHRPGRPHVRAAVRSLVPARRVVG